MSPSQRRRQRALMAGVRGCSRRSPAFAVYVVVTVLAVAGCTRARDAAQQSPEAAESHSQRDAEKPGTPPTRPKPAGKPAPTAECGHAVAFAGWRPDKAGGRDVLLVCDPGDNSLEEIVHAWEGPSRSLPVHFGKQRPTLILQPAGAFTVTGAVVVRPRSAEARTPRMSDTVARAMPDLSQDISPNWIGLCGPTSAADVLFSMHAGDDDVLTGFERGPGDAADAAAARLIAGGLDAIEPQSLAGRMGIGPDGVGSTNEGMRRGLASWLDEADRDAWEVELDWFDDAVGDRPRARQREFFGRLAAATEAGGGAILCLWPGTDFADQPIEPPAAEEAATPEQQAGEQKQAAQRQAGPQQRRADAMPALPAAEFPDLPAPAEQPAGQAGGLPGRPESGGPREWSAAAEASLAAARRHLKRGNAQRALDEAAKAVSLLHQAARRDPDVKPQLEAALELCRQCERGIPAGRVVDGTKRNEYR